MRAAHAALVGLALSLGVDAASAHPHVVVTAASQIIYAPDGAMTGVRHEWTFDDMFSAYALQGLATKTKGVYTREELASLAQTNVESLKEFGFFTFAKSGGRKSKFSDPVDYYLAYNGTALVLHFTLPLKAPLKTRQLVLEIYDPSYFVDFQLAKADPVKLNGAPADCKLAIQRPSDGSAAAKKLDESTFTDGENSNYGAMFANRITVDCP